MFFDHLQPRTAAQSKHRLFRQIGEILITTEQMTEPLRALDAAPGTGKLWQREGLKVQILHTMPPAVQGVMVGALTRQLHHSAAFALTAGMLLKDLIRRKRLDAGAVDEQAERM